MPFNPYAFNPRAFGPSAYGDSSSSPFQQLRAKSIFDQPQTPEDNTKRFLSQRNPPPQADFSQPDTSAPDSNQYDPTKNYAEMKRLLTTRGPALTAYQSALQDQPTDENTPVSTGRKVMGTLAGIAGGLAHGPQGGISAANEIIDSPYKTAMRDYSVKMKNLGESAKMEQDERDSQVKLIDYADKSQLDYAKYGQTERQHLRDAEDKRLTREMTRGANESLDAYRRRVTDIQGRQADIAAARQKEDETFHKGSLQVQNRTAATGERNAGTNEANAKTAAGRLTEEQSRDKALADYRKDNSKKVSPQQQRVAEQMAMEQLRNDPDGKNFVGSPNDRGIYEESGPSDAGWFSSGNAQSYQNYKRKKDALIKTIIQKGVPFNDNEDEGIFDIGRPE